MKGISVRVHDGPDCAGCIYDIAIGAIGYESRSRFIFETQFVTARSKVALKFQKGRECSFEFNLDFFVSNGFSAVDFASAQLERLFEERILDSWLNAGRGNDECKCEYTVLVDLSSMSRHMLACVLSAICKKARTCKLTVDFVYAVAEYTAKPSDTPQIVNAGPVLPEFAAWNLPDLPLAVVIGLGYEPYRALGVFELLEPAELWIFEGTSSDSRYDADVRSANQLLFDITSVDYRMPYRIWRPFETYIALESLIEGVTRDHRTVMVPFGPKIFALCCLLVAAGREDDTAVWRVSSSEDDPVVDRKAAGDIYRLRAVFSPANCGSNVAPCGDA